MSKPAAPAKKGALQAPVPKFKRKKKLKINTDRLHLNDVFKEWLFVHEKASTEHELWELFQTHFSRVHQDARPAQTHRPSNLFNYIKALRKPSTRQSFKLDVAKAWKSVAATRARHVIDPVTNKSSVFFCIDFSSFSPQTPRVPL